MQRVDDVIGGTWLPHRVVRHEPDYSVARWGERDLDAQRRHFDRPQLSAIQDPERARSEQNSRVLTGVDDLNSCWVAGGIRVVALQVRFDGLLHSPVAGGPSAR